jgi:hypothetical protein
LNSAEFLGFDNTITFCCSHLKSRGFELWRPNLTRLS